jgi:murein DD-endopeptidase MepM/ murein hydrolase activator NlpD
MNSYQVRRGDTLSSIAARYHTSVAQLAQQNGIANPNLIRAGQQLRMPGTGHSTVDAFEPARRTSPTSQTSPSSSSGGVRDRLVDAARQRATGHRRGGHCARGVSDAIQNSMGVNVRANANRLDNALADNRRFREVHGMSLDEALRTPGLVVTWERSNHSSGGLRYGHTAITSGDGRTTYSDIVDRNTTGNGRTGMRIFEPVA